MPTYSMSMQSYLGSLLSLNFLSAQQTLFLSFFGGIDVTHNPDWLLWRPDADPATPDNRLGTFSADVLRLNAGATWLIDAKQELRVRLEAIGLDATPQQAWRAPLRAHSAALRHRWSAAGSGTPGCLRRG